MTGPPLMQLHNLKLVHPLEFTLSSPFDYANSRIFGWIWQTGCRCHQPLHHRKVPLIRSIQSISADEVSNASPSAPSTECTEVTEPNLFSFSIPSHWTHSAQNAMTEYRECPPSSSSTETPTESPRELSLTDGPSDDRLDQLSKPLSALKLQSKASVDLNQQDQSGREWTEILSESVASKWDAAATPIRSSLKKLDRRQRLRSPSRSPSSSKRVNWGQIECRNFEQRCGILSGGVPNHKGPSLHLGRLLTENTLRIDEWESAATSKGVRELKVKERKERVRLFSPKDLGRKRLKMDREEISRLNKSRENIGCQCISIYKMKKEQLVDRVIVIQTAAASQPTFDAVAERKRLKKLKKNQVLEEVMRAQFAEYGRYDVCCIDASCECFQHGVECQIDSDCCDCGGDTVYNNYIGGDWAWTKAPSTKKDSLCCGNPNGNTLRVTVTDYRGDPELKEHAVVKVAEDGFVKFKSPAVQKHISEWNEHYNDCDMKEDAKESTPSDGVRGVLRFD